MSFSDDGSSAASSIHHTPTPQQATRKKKHADLVFYTHFDDILARINPFGPYQIFACIVILWASIEWAGNSTFLNVIGSLEPNWNCRLADNTTIVVKAPTNDDKCAFLKNNCTEWWAKKDSVEFHSLVAHFKLVCDEKDDVKIIQLVQAGGSLIGSILGGHLGDHFGRKTCFFTGQLLIIVTSIFSVAATTWQKFMIVTAVNGFLYGLIEVTSMCMMMEYTSNRYRMVLASCFEWPIAYMAIALIAYLTKEWQLYFIFLNLIASPAAIGFMMFVDSPRFLIAKDKLGKACEVLNDLAHQRWNDTRHRFKTTDIQCPRDETGFFYNFYHLFATTRLAKQSIMQILSIFTYAIVSNAYLYTVSGMHDNTIMFTFLDGAFRLLIPPLLIFVDYKFIGFGRRLQFVGALVLEVLLFGAAFTLVACNVDYTNSAVTVLIIVCTMINDCIFWINTAMITAQRYPTVIRCIAFGCLHSTKHVGTIVGLLVLRPLLDHHVVWAFAIPLGFLIITLLAGIVLQPETKGKALMDQMVQISSGRMENEIPKALMRLAVGHRFAQIEQRQRVKEEWKKSEAETRLKYGHELIEDPEQQQPRKKSSVKPPPLNRVGNHRTASPQPAAVAFAQRPSGTTSRPTTSSVSSGSLQDERM